MRDNTRSAIRSISASSKRRAFIMSFWYCQRSIMSPVFYMASKYLSNIDFCFIRFDLLINFLEKELFLSLFL